MKQSPAPVVSTTVQGCAGTASSAPAEISRAPRAPKRQHDPAYARRNEAADAAHRLRLAFVHEGEIDQRPEVAKKSRSGDGLNAVRIPRARPRRSAARVVSDDRLPCRTSRSPAAAPASIATPAVRQKPEAASFVVTMAFSPDGRHQDEGDVASRRPSTSTSDASTGSRASAVADVVCACVRADRRDKAAWPAPRDPARWPGSRPCPPDRATTRPRGWMRRAPADRPRVIVSSSATLPMTRARIGWPSPLPKGPRMQLISDRSPGAIREIFGRDKVLIGMIHCPPFPGLAPLSRGGDGGASTRPACAMPSA